MKMRNKLLFLMSGALLSACGGGGGDWKETKVSPTNPDGQALATGVYKLTFSAISTAHLDAPISGIEVAVKLPAGLSVSTTTGGTGQISSTSLLQGTAIQDTSLTFGNYSASTRTAYLAVATTQNNFRSGQYLTLLFNVSSGTSVTPSDIYAMNAAYKSYRVVGLDTVSHNTVVMTDRVLTTLGMASE